MSVLMHVEDSRGGRQAIDSHALHALPVPALSRVLCTVSIVTWLVPPALLTRPGWWWRRSGGPQCPWCWYRGCPWPRRGWTRRSWLRVQFNV